MGRNNNEVKSYKQISVRYGRDKKQKLLFCTDGKMHKSANFPKKIKKLKCENKGERTSLLCRFMEFENFL